MEVKTNRGFSVIEFTDRYGIACTLQESSLATEAAIWFGCDEANPRHFVANADCNGVPVEMPPKYIADTRMHLNQDQVKNLLPHLIKFAETGGL